MKEVNEGGKPLSLFETNLVLRVDQNEKNFRQEMWLLKIKNHHETIISSMNLNQ